MDDVNLPHEFLKAAGHNMIVKSAGAHGTHDPVREAQFPSCQRGGYGYARGDRPANRGRKDKDFGPRLRQAIYLVPSGSADPVRPQLEREAVQHTHALDSVTHYLSLMLCFTGSAIIA